jgi:VRR-NUC domain.
MRENVIERALFREAKKMGCMAVKFVSPGLAGVPDRILLLPHGRCVFVEVKAPGKKPRPQQEKRIRQLRELGFLVYVIDSLEQVGEVLDEIQTT